MKPRPHTPSNRGTMLAASRCIRAVATLVLLASCAPRSERLSPAEQCVAAELQATRNYTLCMMRATAPAASPQDPRLACERTLLADWEKIKADIAKCGQKYGSASPRAAMHFADVLLCGGAVVGGTCWHLGTDDQSCTQVCAAFGQVYDPLTASYAGSAGTDEHCQEVLSALGVTQPFAGHPSCGPTPNGLGLGCLLETHDGQYGLRCAWPDTTADAAGVGPGVFRACACH